LRYLHAARTIQRKIPTKQAGRRSKFAYQLAPLRDTIKVTRSWPAGLQTEDKESVQTFENQYQRCSQQHVNQTKKQQESGPMKHGTFIGVKVSPCLQQLDRFSSLGTKVHPFAA